MSRLVLTRKLGESVVIHCDDEIIAEIKVNRVDRNQTRLVITADTKIKIDRQESYLSKQESRLQKK